MPTHKAYKFWAVSVGGDVDKENHFCTRLEAEQAASSIISGMSPGKFLAVEILGIDNYEVIDSPKRAFVQGLKHTGPLSHDTRVYARWDPISGWLIKDDRSTTRRPNVAANKAQQI